MEKDANYALVGFSTLLLFAGLVIFSLWLARLQFAQDYDVYDIIFDGPVRGLSQGGEVHFNGIKVGEVTRIQLDPDNPSRVIARARVTSDVPIRVDSYATLEPQGITGVNYVQITAGTPARRLLKDTVPPGTVPRLRTQRSALSDILEGGGTVLTRTVEALDRVNRVLSDQNIKTVSAAINDAQAVTAELKARRAMIADAQKSLQSIDKAATEIAALSKSSRELVDGDGKRTIENLAAASEEAQAAAKDLRGMLGRLDGPATDFANNGLPELTATMQSLQQTAESLDRLIRNLESNPRGLVGKAPAQEIKVKP
ncbi:MULTISPECIES: MlaD family protein [Phenylobacterium]|uniref:Phospholipid/cholesterol/gamma-HCH transport system substrate-binding protein n=1 Tax=Phenylobacterium koreense TaxID=266125 RepID=A0ABV2EDG4_9CAUL